VNHLRRALVIAILTASSGALLIPMTHADPPETNEPRPEQAEQRFERFEGTWRLDQPRDEAQQVVSEAVEDAANQFNFMIRGIARSRLREGTPVHSRVEVSFEGDQVTVRFGDESYTTELGRTEVRRNPEGEEMRVTQRIRPNGQLEQVFETEGGTRRYVYTPLSDGRMRIATTTDSPRMPQPMYFMLDYRRAA
jgi:hypothetical protein